MLFAYAMPSLVRHSCSNASKSATLENTSNISEIFLEIALWWGLMVGLHDVGVARRGLDGDVIAAGLEKLREDDRAAYRADLCRHHTRTQQRVRHTP